MRIAAIVTVRDERQRTGKVPAALNQDQATETPAPEFSYLGAEVLGETLLARTLERLGKIASLPTIVVEDRSRALPWVARAPRQRGHWSATEAAIAQQIARGAEVLLFLRLDAYCDLDFEQLFEFHRQTKSSLTRVFASDGPLEIALANTCALASDSGTCGDALEAGVAGERKFHYPGYLNPLRRPQDYYKLMEDGLCGRCALRPRGEEVAAGVWYGRDAQVDEEATILAPAFIGAHSRIAAGATVASASVESNCEIDCGTTVSNSWVLENTYVGLALEVRRSLVSNQKLFHLDRDLELNVIDQDLIGVNSRTMPLLAHLESFFLGTPDYGA